MEAIITARSWVMPAAWRSRRGIGVCWAATPMKARRTRPWRTNSPSTKLAVLAATAKQMPCAPMITAVFTPTTSPCEDTSGPPELPGLSAASVWITSSISRPVRERKLRPSAETTPVVTVDSKPSGLPMAITSWPRFKRLESPSGAASQRHRLDDAQQSEIGVGIVADQPRGEVLAFGRRHFDARGGTGGAARAGDVAIGQDQPVGRHHDAGPGAAAGAAVGFAGVNREPDHGRADPVDHVDDGARIGVEERLVLDRNFGRLSGGSAAAAPGGIVQRYDFHVLSVP